jgi:7-keto-8-aminopelargonate synthetase-like enzyme
MPEPEPLQQIDRTYVRYRNRRLSYFSGCDYFRLASHPSVVAAAHTGLKRFGLGVAASRLTTGNHRLYLELEEKLAAFFGAPSALLVSTGYATDLVVAQALAGNFSHALIDERSHPALQDAVRFLDCPVLKFRHRDVDDCQRAVKRCGPQTKLILLTDGMFAHDGSLAPLSSYLRVLPQDATLLVDDAHAAGVLGSKGRGSLEATHLSRRHAIQTISLSKAFGAFGGAILCPHALRQRILEKSRLFIGSTPMPLPWVCAALKSLELLRTDVRMRQRLNGNALRLKQGLRQAGVVLAETPGPIIAWPETNPRRQAGLKRSLLAAGIFPPILKYPGAPPAGYLRFVISSEHSQAQLDRLLEVLTSRLDRSVVEQLATVPERWPFRV